MKRRIDLGQPAHRGIDPQEAPYGFTAASPVPHGPADAALRHGASCIGCYFLQPPTKGPGRPYCHNGTQTPCTPWRRHDGQWVIFLEQK